MRKRKNRVVIYLNDKELKYADMQANKTKLSRSALFRFLIMGYRPKEPPPVEYYALMKELRAIGKNMNQIAARANATGFFMMEEYSQNVKQHFKIMLSIQKAVTLPEKGG